MNDAEHQELMLERHSRALAALRACVAAGVAVEHVQALAFEAGIDWRDVVPARARPEPELRDPPF